MITYAALCPHPPLIIPDIGGNRIGEVERTVQGMKRLAEQIAASAPETLFVITPHGNVFADCVSCLGDKELYGDFEDFGSSINETSFKNDVELVLEVGQRSAKQGINFVVVNAETARKYRLKQKLDHGILVPLHYVKHALSDNNVKIVALSIGFLSILELYGLGKIIQEASKALNRRVAIIASGDMSHRLKDEGPYDYHPDGKKYDFTIRKLLEAGDVSGVLSLPENLRKNAGECGYRSIVIMLGGLDAYSFRSVTYSYEGPFGVGYLVSGFKPEKDIDSFLAKLKQQKQEKIEIIKAAESTPVKWARIVLESYIKEKEKPILPQEYKDLKQKKAGVFVSLKKNGQLRGCIGTISPVYADLAEEIAANAVSAGTSDPRFLPVEEGELPGLIYSVDILGEAESCQKEDLDPKNYGVMVSTGSKRGLLLPDLEGVDTVEQQLSIALQKAGINPGEHYNIERFKVTRYK